MAMCGSQGSAGSRGRARGFAPGPHQGALPLGSPPRAEPLGPFSWSGWTGRGPWGAASMLDRPSPVQHRKPRPMTPCRPAAPNGLIAKAPPLLGVQGAKPPPSGPGRSPGLPPTPALPWLLLLAFLLLPCLARASDGPPPLDQVQRADGVLVVPDHFLRRWDPVTIFLPADTGPAQAAPEDHPERFVTLTPEQSGAWRWLGPRVLQFRPAEPWTPLRRVTLTAGSRTATLISLLPEPLRTAPADQPEGIANLDTISLTFQDPVDPAALARLLTIELRKLPGIDAAGGQMLTREDFDIKPLERANRADPQTYLVMLHQPLPDQRLAILRLRLSDEPGLDDPIFELRLRTPTPFTLSSLDCGDGYESRNNDGLTLCTPSSNPDDSGAGVQRRSVMLTFSAPPEALDVLHARNALRITPPVDDLTVAPGGPDNAQALRVGGSFAAETEYTLRLAPGSLADQRGRALGGIAQPLRFAFRPVPPRLVWDASQGIAEQFGPQMVPLRGHGYEHADVRIHRIDPLDRDFWPFPPGGVDTADAASPPLPGNEPSSWTGGQSIRARDIAARIKALGSPAVSELLALPQAAGGADAKFGLDLQPLLARIAGPRQAGTYLVGLRPMHGTERHWIRLQVTDLSLTAVEEPGLVRFAVTSLAGALPVAGAQISIEGLAGAGQGDQEFRRLAQGTTDADGAFSYVPRNGAQAAPQRIVVQKAADTLVLQTAPGPQQYASGNWSQPRGNWLAWSFTKTALSAREEKPRILCHVFTERPIYRPEEAVEIRGFVRRYLHGALSETEGKGTLLVQGPDKQEWRFPTTLDDTSGFYLHFDAKTAMTGDYTVSFQPDHAPQCDSADFKKEAYRLPTFEVLLNNPPQAPLDAPFQVGLLARYYAGGVVTDRPVKWRVTQFPYTWNPPGNPPGNSPGREGFLFSSDARFSGEQAFRSTPVMQSDGKTDAGGAAQLTLDPTLEPTAQPRTYVVEATVTGDDGQQIRNVAHVPALPPFVLGLKMPRYLPKPGAIAADLLALDATGKPRAGLDMTVRLIKRDWNSVLQASDFTQGTAKYVTQEIDSTLEERHVSSTEAPQTLNFAAAEAGIYVVEVTAADRLGRRQTLRVDCFMAGDTPVTWSRPPARTVTLTTDKDDYAPGADATLLVESPFQTARALVVTEQPDGRFDYAWVDVTNGVGRYTLAIRKEQMPRFPVHVLLMRGRLAGPPPSATAPFDQGKPTTLAATAWVKVRPVQNRVTVAFDAPAAARPAQTVEVTLRLSDEAGKPLPGEATFWMVDQAVLALAKEAPLDPLPKFIVERPSRMAARDSRNMPFGVIPLQENPGGGEGEENPGIENISVRRNFTPVPIYLPHVKVGPDGVARIQVRLPDTLTVFMLRAEATSGPDRFGFATGQIRVRQPVVAQPVLPRFLRPGDTFDAEVLGRVVEGPGGAGTAIISLDGLTATGAKEQTFTWNGGAPAKASFPVSVPQPVPGKETGKIRFLVRRDADQVGDGVEITLPIRPDRPGVHERRLVEVAPGATAELPAPPDDVRAGSYAGSLAVATDPALARALGALDYLLTYPFGCTEQRIALAASELALLPFAPIAGAEGLSQRVGADVAVALSAISQAVDENGLVGYWPHTRGLVTLTAWSYELMIRAEAAHLPVDPALRDRLAVVLNQSLRSDFPHLLTDAALLERATALYALAAGGKLDAAYASELARTAGALNTGGLAMMVSAIAATPNADRALVAGLLQTLWSRVHVLARNGVAEYAGLADFYADPLILPSETRGLAEVTRAVAVATPEEPRLALLRGGLVALGGPDGWGSTNADAAALRALAASWDVAGTAVPVTVTLPEGTLPEPTHPNGSRPDGSHPDGSRPDGTRPNGTQPDGAQPGGMRSDEPRANGMQPNGTLSGGTRQVTLGHAVPMARWTTTQPGPMRVANGGARPVLALQQAGYVPAGPGWQATPVQHGFVLTRTVLRVPGGAAPMEALAPGPDGALHLANGAIVEETAELVTPEPRTMVAVVLPLAAGLEPLNPNLATAPAEAAPSAGPTLAPTYTAFGDDSVLYVYEALPAGTYRFRFRAQAGTVGSFTEPPGTVEMMHRTGRYRGERRIACGDRAVIVPTRSRGAGQGRVAVGRATRFALSLLSPISGRGKFVVFLVLAALPYFAVVLSRAHFEAPAPTPIVDDRHGVFLAQFGDDLTAADGRHRTEYGYWPVDAPPERIVSATLALEDRRFWSHPGVDPRAVLRAAWQDLDGLRQRSGASTIAMQVARMQRPEPRTLWAKAAEAGTALLLTVRYGRAAVLAQYLRLVPYGNGSHGIGHAARWYFDKPASDLSWAEIALLCAVPRAPAAYNPMHPAGLTRARDRAGRILEALHRQAVLTEAEYRAATTQLATLQPNPPLHRPPDALHPILRLHDVLAEAPAPPHPSDDRVSASLDLGVQQTVATLLRDRLAAWRVSGAQQAAAIVVERGDNAVLAAVGSGGFSDPRGGAIDFTRAIRSPGSTLKPFLYAAALQRGLLHPAETLDDGPDHAAGIRNADSRYLGRVPPGQALANSRNVPAADVLRRMGVGAGFDLFRALGLHTLDAAPDSLGLAMAIGALPTSLDRLTDAYAALADDGMQRDLLWYRGQPEAPPRRVFSATAAREVGLFLSDPLARLPSFARYGSTEYPFAVAVKTGTSQGYRDAWTVAWSQRFLVGAWVGRSDAGTMAGLGGANSAARLVQAILLTLHHATPGELADTSLGVPDGYEPRPVCAGPAETPKDICSRTLLAWLPRAVPGPVPVPPQQTPGTDAAVRLSVVAPEADSRIWRNPESPPAANRLVLRAKTVPPVPQVVWYVDDAPFALSTPDAPVSWPLRTGEHRFQIGLPLRPERSRAVRLVVE